MRRGVVLAAAVSAAALLLAGCGGNGGTPNGGAACPRRRRLRGRAAGPAGAGRGARRGNVRLRARAGARRLPRHRRQEPFDREPAGARLGGSLARRQAVAPDDRTVGERRRARRLGGSCRRRDARLRRPLPRAARPGSTCSSPSRSARTIQGALDLEVADEPKAPDVGAEAFPSRTPTIASTDGDFAALTTRTPPDVGLLRYSVADSLDDRAPFVVAFATPKFCTSRACGPVVDVVDHVRKRLGQEPGPLHPRRDLRGQPAARAEPLGEGVEAAHRAVGVPRRPRRQDQGALRGLRLRRGAGSRGAGEAPTLTSTRGAR